jgi:aspartyl-tRNA(Asn)/glutamyl-tRNA(Gln) amidotransferase subunit A
MNTAYDVAQKVRSGETSAASVLEQSFAAIEARDHELNAFLHLDHDGARAAAKAVDENVAAGQDPGPLAGVPIGIKDNLAMRGIPTTCGSKILDGWKPPYTATVVERLLAAGAVPVGKTNLDEFAMGSSTENSAFGPSRNPHDVTKVPGGSSGGSAVAVAAGFVPVALGSDTGGSIRQPAAFCGLVGYKPSYGHVSRYGLVAFSSSLDQVGPFTTTVADAALVTQVIGGHDPADSTSMPDGYDDLLAACERGVQGLKVGLCSDLLDGADAEIVERVRQAAAVLEAAGAEIIDLAIPELRLGLSAYYLIAPAEASSNLARYDGVRFGLRVEREDVAAMNVATRTAGFGAEVKRRIMLGTYALSAGYYDAYYGQAQKTRRLITNALDTAYGKVDVLLGATTPTTAFGFGDKVADPMSMYLSDLFTIPTNLAGHGAMSVPFGTSADGMPIGVQILSPGRRDDRLFQVGAVLEAGVAK